MLQKVLVQWTPDEDLRLRRVLERGEFGGGSACVTAVGIDDPRFAEAFLYANKHARLWVQGFPLVQAGLAGSTRYDGSAWQADRAVVAHAFSEPPTTDDLIEVLADMHGPLDKGEVTTVTEAVLAYKAERERQRNEQIAEYREQIASLNREIDETGGSIVQTRPGIKARQRVADADDVMEPYEPPSPEPNGPGDGDLHEEIEAAADTRSRVLGDLELTAPAAFLLLGLLAVVVGFGVVVLG